ncbi:hypothetical protein PNOK_0033100 [Pyrrhoderma noxium]|uniref:Uncharacterized protein n=1 Tax=Pyrrhoderma noxium TaxID=2282107 RepID=A0A286UUJ0_9AGAM|nr:hypothetical protein PNOK_0033100 [Pyrrhoderma noxium]
MEPTKTLCNGEAKRKALGIPIEPNLQDLIKFSGHDLWREDNQKGHQYLFSVQVRSYVSSTRAYLSGKAQQKPLIGMAFYCYKTGCDYCL